MATFPAIRIEGGLLGPDVLEQLLSGDLPGQRPADFGLEGRRSVTDEIAAAFADARALWGVFQHRLDRLPADDLATSVTRDAWAIPFLGLLGYEPRFNQRAYDVDGTTFAISHRAGLPSPSRTTTGNGNDEHAPPVHIVGARQELGRVPVSGRPRLAPHSLVQEYLNRTEHVWGLVTNGLTLRLLRDCTFVRRQAYVEFDLPSILDEQRFQDFAALYRLLHRTRLPRGAEDAGDCLLEKYYAYSVEQGGRVREHLRDGVEECITRLANGFLRHAANEDLRRRISPDCAGNDHITAGSFYRQLLCLVYRFLFLLVSEDRGLLSPDPLYRDHYSIARSRRLLDQRAALTDQDDLWQSLRVLWLVLIKDAPQPSLNNRPMASALGLPVLNGDLFAPQALDACTISNRDLLEAFWFLAWYQESRTSPPRRVNYAALDVEELGSVYESLLEFHPAIDWDATRRPGFSFVTGSERKTTGSYYTPPQLVSELIQSALEPVIRDRLAVVGAKERESAKPKEAAKPVRTRRETPAPAEAIALELPGEYGSARGRADAERALLSIRICDPACGSGHFLLAAARRLGKELARVRTGEDEPAPERVREAVRDVISHCIYGVDRNPLAVDLCRVALWLESHTADKPLTFLDHRIRCGDSLVGVFDLEVLKEGIPDKAFDAVEGDDKPTARELTRRNRDERRGQGDLFAWKPGETLTALVRHSREVDEIADDSPEAIRRKKQLFEQSHEDRAWLRQKQACDLWTAAFFQTLTPETTAVTSASLAEHLAGRPIDPRVLGHAAALSVYQRFFHWPLEFPEVFADGGFDVLLSNPPWERIKLQEQEFFAVRDARIATAPNKATRARLIAALPKTNAALYAELTAAVHAAACLGKFLRQSSRFPLTAIGDINTYAVFTETIGTLLRGSGRAGIILPLGVVTDDTTKKLFSSIVSDHRLISVIGFENEEHIFPAVDHRFKFCLFSVAGRDGRVDNLKLTFFTRHFRQLSDERRQFTLAPDDFATLNPNTRTCPIFRTRPDAELTRKIYHQVPILVREGQPDGNPWGIRFMTMFHMSNDSDLFADQPGDGLLPLYEAKMMWQFDHRFTTYEGATEQQLNVGILPQVTPEQKADPAFCVRPRYWVAEIEVLNRLAPPTEEEEQDLAKGRLSPAELLDRQRERAPQWLLGFRDITNATNERTAIFSFLPRAGVGNNAPLMLMQISEPALQLCLLANVNALVFDFCARQKVGGTHMNFFLLQQLPVLPPTFYAPADVAYVASRVASLVNVADDLRVPCAAPWESAVDDARRAQLRAELDAWFARAYGLTRDELRYILDPQDVYGPDFPGETFRVLKEKELARFGEYRTRRLVLDAWDRLPPSIGAAQEAADARTNPHWETSP
jgi:hypothetical protein